MRTPAIVLFYIAYDLKVLRTDTIVRVLVLVALLVGVLALLNVALQYIAWLDSVESLKKSLAASDLIPPTIPRITGVVGHPNALARLTESSSPLRSGTCTAPSGKD